jgi:hypothetical protein
MRPRSSRAALLTALGLASALLPLVVSGGCGGPEPKGPGPVDRTEWKPTFEAAMDALVDPDRRALLVLLSPEGRVTLDADLAHLGVGLRDPLEGPRVLAKIRARWPEVPEDLIARARRGDLDAAWQLWMRASTPPGVRPQQAGMKLEKGVTDDLDLLYRYGPDSQELRLRLKRIRGQWFVDFLQLGSEAR